MKPGFLIRDPTDFCGFRNSPDFEIFVFPVELFPLGISAKEASLVLASSLVQIEFFFSPGIRLFFQPVLIV